MVIRFVWGGVHSFLLRFFGFYKVLSVHNSVIVCYLALCGCF